MRRISTTGGVVVFTRDRPRSRVKPMQRRLDMSSTVLPVPEDTSFLVHMSATVVPRSGSGPLVRHGSSWPSSTKTAIRRTMT